MTTRTDHAEISTLIDRFFKALDDREFTADRWRADALRATEEALERYERTQHIAGGVLVDADADAGAVGASVSWNALMTHVHRAATLQGERQKIPGRRRPGIFWVSVVCCTQSAVVS
ncbi:hypothetical protein [Streptomyces sp. BBFR115]|uniref:hypothetical protein n=1 Tax=Streptomyces sp. BBFR115 TaxID=3448173 RepID=UPI003F76BED3